MIDLDHIKNLALDSIANAIVITDHQGQIIWVNLAFTHLTGYTAEEAVGKTSILFNSGKQDHTIYKNLWETILSGQIWQGLIVNKRKDGSLYTEEQTITPVCNTSGEITHFIAVKQDVTERQRVDNILQQHLAMRTALHEIGLDLSAQLDLPTLFNTIIDRAMHLLNASMGALYLTQPEENILKMVAARGALVPYLGVQLQPGEGGSGKILQSGKPLLISDYKKWEGRSDSFANLPVGTAIGVPLFWQGRVIGVINVNDEQPNRFGLDEVEIVSLFADQAAVAIENATLLDNLQRTNKQLQIAYDATIESWSRLLDLREHEIERHSMRVTQMTVDLARRLGIDEEQIIHIRRGALLHDIGKMGVPDSILLKPGKLTKNQWEVMRRHPQLAYKILSPIPFLQPALDIPYCHHEKWDGTGYPRGLKGEEIPLAARIFAVADVWDALTNDRPYRTALSKSKTLKKLREQSGKYFDPQIVDLFIKTIKL